MKILLVVATEPESEWLRQSIPMNMQGPCWQGKAKDHDITLLHTGIGMVNTAFRLGQFLQGHTPDLAVNLGIAGSFRTHFQLGTVVEIVEDTFPELGVDIPGGFLDLKAMGFPHIKDTDLPVYNSVSNPLPSSLDLPRVSGITVNTVHGNPPGIEIVQQRWNPDVESMEGAAFFHAMTISGIPYFAFRGISNYVELRDRSRWEIGLAARNVQKFILQNILEK